MATTLGPILQGFTDSRNGVIRAQQAVISCALTGHNVIVAGVANQSIYVVAFHIFVASAVTMTWNDFDGTSTYVALTGAMPIAAGGVNIKAWSGGAHFWTPTVGHGLDLNLSGTVLCTGWLTYAQF